MHWADKVALGFAITLLAISALVMLGLDLLAGTSGLTHVLASFGPRAAALMAGSLLFVWLPLRSAAVLASTSRRRS